MACSDRLRDNWSNALDSERQPAQEEPLFQALSPTKYNRTQDFTRRTPWEHLVHTLSETAKAVCVEAAANSWAPGSVCLPLGLYLQPRPGKTFAHSDSIHADLAGDQVPAELMLAREEAWRASEPNTIVRLFNASSYWLLRLPNVHDDIDWISSVLGALFYTIHQRLSDDWSTEDPLGFGLESSPRLPGRPAVIADSRDAERFCSSANSAGTLRTPGRLGDTSSGLESPSSKVRYRCWNRLPVFVQTTRAVTDTTPYYAGIGIAWGFSLVHYELHVQASPPPGVDDLESLYNFFRRCVAHWTDREQWSISDWETQCRLSMTLSYERELEGARLSSAMDTSAGERTSPRLRLALTLRWPLQSLAQYERFEVLEAPECVLWLPSETKPPASPIMDRIGQVNGKVVQPVRLLQLAKHLLKMSRTAPALPSQPSMCSMEQETAPSAEHPAPFLPSLFQRLKDTLEELTREDASDQTDSPTCSPLVHIVDAVSVSDLQTVLERLLDLGDDDHADPLTALALEAPWLLTDWACLRALYGICRQYPEVLAWPRTTASEGWFRTDQTTSWATTQQQPSPSLTDNSDLSSEMGGAASGYPEKSSRSAGNASTSLADPWLFPTDEACATHPSAIVKARNVPLEARSRSDAASRGVSGTSLPTSGDQRSARSRCATSLGQLTRRYAPDGSPALLREWPRHSLSEPMRSITVVSGVELPDRYASRERFRPETETFTDRERPSNEGMASAPNRTSPALCAGVAGATGTPVDTKASEPRGGLRRLGGIQTATRAEILSNASGNSDPQQAPMDDSLQAFLEHWTLLLIQACYDQTCALFSTEAQNLSTVHSSFRSTTEACQMLFMVSSRETGVFRAHLEHAIDELEQLLSMLLPAKLLQETLLGRYELVDELLRCGEVSLRSGHTNAALSSNDLLHHLMLNVFGLSEEDVFENPETREYLFDAVTTTGRPNLRLLFRLSADACSLATVHETA
ncbi:hypothetical protein CCYA_CCYA08G2424 [Cyanidiococcus yangmingshanensis]|nr:hypothetical protein CCYA_CCYA08G2424 [Cyanidiococcus yangmingshanensis]